MNRLKTQMLSLNLLNGKWHIIISMIGLFCWNPAEAQHYYLPLSNEVNLRYDAGLHRVGEEFHTSIKPYISDEVRKTQPLDSFPSWQMPDKKFYRTQVGRKLFSEHLLRVDHEDYFLYADPNIEFNGGQSMETGGDINTIINSRGVSLGARFGKGFSFQSSFVESQATFSSYIDSAVRETFVVPGGSRVKNFNQKFDYGTASGTISYSLKKYFSFQFGHDKNFIGDGYRSLLLSDNTYNYPFLKLNANFWKVKYMVLYAMFQDGPYITINDESYRRKYGTFHYLDINIGKRLTFGIMEAVIWKYDSTRAFDINYLNPVIFLRPVEFSVGSPDNSLIGFNLRYKISSSISIYGQLMLDEFKKKEVFDGNGWWANKQGIQGGIKSFNLLGVKNLHVSTEFNYVRPFTYQHRSSRTAYAHYNQPLAHPLGANFWESVSTLNYAFKRWHLLMRGSYARVGYDIDSIGQPRNYGNNVLLSYDSRPPGTDYGNDILQGLDTKVINAEFRVWYLLNPASNLSIEAGIRARQAENENGNLNTLFLHFGIRTLIGNRYFDF
jgi:hypothetical protein